MISKHKRPTTKLRILLYGGELFETDAFVLENMGDFFAEYMDKCIDKLILTSGLVTAKLEYIDAVLSKLNPDQIKRTSLFTSWDPSGRFKSGEIEADFFNKIDYLRSKYDGLGIQINIVLSGDFCRRVTAGTIDFRKLESYCTVPLSLTLYQISSLEYAPTIDELTTCIMAITTTEPVIANKFISNFCEESRQYCLFIYSKDKDRLVRGWHVPRMPKCRHLSFNKWAKGFTGECVYCYLTDIYNMYKVL
jgi:hypothetical protein